MKFIASSLDRSQAFEIRFQEPGLVEVSASSTEPCRENNLFLCRGMVDLQVNGYGGIDMADPGIDVPTIETFCRNQLQMGVVRFLPTLTTQAVESFSAALGNLQRLAKESTLFRTMFLGFHLEGPFISPQDGPRGAHPRRFCREPDLVLFEELQSRAGGQIRMVTLSPEYDSAMPFIEKVAESCVVSIGHTAATPKQIRQAAEAGATLSTHLGNGMHKELARHPNYLWEQLAEDRLMAGLIADGVHLDRSVLQSMIRSKGAKRCFLVSDSTVLSGMPPGRYENSSLGDVEVTEDHRLVIAGQRIYQAGAYRPLIDGLNRLIREQGMDLVDGFRLVSDHPLKGLGLGDPDDELLDSRVLLRADEDGVSVVLATVGSTTVTEKDALH
ncbi:MAG: N-acetylglucosamine-6-phosphate deacetylase [Planctomycetota bacterium]|nr:N-acetylglucosamine-6-phosphate deacetylase [Planctomycetota bacterium]